MPMLCLDFKVVGQMIYYAAAMKDKIMILIYPLEKLIGDMQNPNMFANPQNFTPSAQIDYQRTILSSFYFNFEMELITDDTVAICAHSKPGNQDKSDEVILISQAKQGSYVAAEDRQVKMVPILPNSGQRSIKIARIFPQKSLGNLIPASERGIMLAVTERGDFLVNKVS